MKKLPRIGRPKIVTKCPDCKYVGGVRDMKIHKPKCVERFLSRIMKQMEAK